MLVTGNVAPSAGCGENHTAALPSMSGSEITLPSAKENESSRDKHVPQLYTGQMYSPLHPRRMRGIGGHLLPNASRCNL